jgi:50S ribosomal protein L16 3-hydroxylase
VALDESMSFSVGFRAKSACDMLSGLADYMIDKELGKALFSDPKRPIHQHQGQINGRDFSMIQAHLQTVLDNPKLIADFAGSFFSKTKCALDLQTPDDPLTHEDLMSALMEQPLIRTGGLRCFYVDETVAQGVCYIEGERFEFGDDLKEMVIALCDQDSLSHDLIQHGLTNSEFLSQLTDWVNNGFWYFQD